MIGEHRFDGVLSVFVEPTCRMGKSDYEDYDNTTASNDILDAAGAPFRFTSACRDSEGNFRVSCSLQLTLPTGIDHIVT